MTINSIKTSGGYEAHKLEHIERQREEVRKAAAESGKDRVSISEEGRLQAGILKAAQDSDGVRADLVSSIKAKVASGDYKPDSQDIARNLIRQGLDIWR